MSWKVSESKGYDAYNYYSGPATTVEIEVKGLPGLTWPLTNAIENWASLQGQNLLYLTIWQDTEPFFDKYKIMFATYAKPTGIGLAPLVIAALVVLAKVIAGIVIAIMVWKTAEVVMRPAGVIAETVQEFGDEFSKVIKDVPPEKLPEVIDKFKNLIGAANPATALRDTAKWVVIGIAAFAGLMIVSKLMKGRTA